MLAFLVVAHAATPYATERFVNAMHARYVGTYAQMPPLSCIPGDHFDRIRTPAVLKYSAYLAFDAIFAKFLRAGDAGAQSRGYTILGLAYAWEREIAAQNKTLGPYYCCSADLRGDADFASATSSVADAAIMLASANLSGTNFSGMWTLGNAQEEFFDHLSGDKWYAYRGGQTYNPAWRADQRGNQTLNLTVLPQAVWTALELDTLRIASDGGDGGAFEASGRALWEKTKAEHMATEAAKKIAEALAPHGTLDGDSSAALGAIRALSSLADVGALVEGLRRQRRGPAGRRAGSTPPTVAASEAMVSDVITAIGDGDWSTTLPNFQQFVARL